MLTPTSQQRLGVRNRPDEPPLIQQTWEDLLFAHWACYPDAVQRTLPPQLKVDTWHGRAYVGVIPFYARNTRLRLASPVPLVSDFYELNVRTYVHDRNGTPGVWFYSLDCSQALAVAGARVAYSLPYYPAVVSTEQLVGNSVRYTCQREGQPRASEFRYTVGEALGQAAAETLEFFLIERYYLFSRSLAGRVYSARVWHQPYSLFKAQLGRWDDEMLRVNGLGAFTDPPAHVIFSKGVDVDIHAPHELASQEPVV